jgi:hypothetical protein
MFRASSLPTSGVLHCTFGTGKFHADFDDLYETYQCRMYSGKLLMMGKEDA